MDRLNPLRYDLGYPCGNPRCYAAVHVSPTCPVPRYERPRSSTPSEVRGQRHLAQLQREGKAPVVKPFPMWWIYLVPPAVVIFGLLMLFSG
ncbi:hypothetical protein [Nocardia grenadensis]|uniref:hypothetical protein n=1 Tax=Nocardia grenadensis TaxID=931537 RepID=UPI0007A3F733|nr:hypothetical protein [Nocardia grenadensis]